MGTERTLVDLPARDRRQNGELVRSHDRVTGGGGLAVHPHLRAPEDIGEPVAVPGTGGGEDLVDRVPVDVTLPAAGGVNGNSEEAGPGHRHPPIIDIDRAGRRNVGSLMPWPGYLAHTARRNRRAMSSSLPP